MNDMHLSDVNRKLSEEPLRKGFGRGLKHAGELDVEVASNESLTS